MTLWARLILKEINRKKIKNQASEIMPHTSEIINHKSLKSTKTASPKNRP